MNKFISICLVAAAVAIGNTEAVAEENRSATRALFIPFIRECAKELSIPKEVVMEADSSNSLENLDGCLLACTCKKVGLMKEEGNFDSEAATKLVDTVVKGDDQVMAKKIIEECSAVNEKSVGDGSKGCERAKLLMQCFAQYKNTFRLF